jgi:regulator of replication initiation timing
VEPEEGIEQLRARISRLVVKVGKLEAKVRALSEEHTKLRLLLAEANAALAEAGVPYLQGNIRERINAYQVFHGLAKLYPKSPDRSV